MGRSTRRLWNVVIVIVLNVVDAGEIDPHPAARGFAFQFAPFYEVVAAATGEEEDLGGGVGLVDFKVEIES